MADNTELQTLYTKEFTVTYEQKQSLLRGTISTEGEVKGNNFVFILESSSDAAVERASNGLIPVAQDNQSSVTCTLKEYHHLARKTNFNIYSSSVPQRLSMQRRGVTSINYKTDQLILTELATTAYVVNSGTAVAVLDGILDANSTLDANFVPRDGERYAVITPKAWAQAMTYKNFSSADWVPDRPFMGYTQWRNWGGCKIAVHPNLGGKGTALAACYVYHKNAVGHAINQGEMQTKVGMNEEQDYSWARTSSYQGSKMIQDEGVVKFNHDDTVAIASVK